MATGVESATAGRRGKGRSPDREAWCREVLDALPVAIYTTDAAGRVTYYNQAAVDLAGRRPELGKDEWCVTWRLYWPDGTPLPHDQCPMAVALKENRPVRGAEAVLERPDGTRVAFLPYPTPLRDTAGRLVGAVNMLVDITDRRAAEGARAYLAAIVDSSDDAIVSKDLNGTVTSWNRGAEAVFGYRADEMVGRPIAVLFPPDRLTEEDTILAKLRRGERIEHFETVRRRKDGRPIDVSLTISPVLDAAGRIIGASKIARDITEKKRAERALRDLNENLERRIADALAERKLWVSVFESTDAMIVALGLDYRVLAGNDAWRNEFEAVYGVRPRVGDNLLDLLAGRPEEQAAARALWDRALAGEEFMVAEAFGNPERQRPYYELSFNVLVDDRAGKRIGAFMYARNVTERMREQARLAAAEAALRQAQKLEAVGQLAAGMAHDFNNLLTAILGNLELAEMYVVDERVRKLVQAAARSAQRGAKLNEQVLAFSRKQHLAPQSVDLNALVVGVEEMLRRTLGGTITVRSALAPDPWPALVDPHQFELVILNLAINARDAMPLGGRILIETRGVKASEVDKSLDLAPGDYVLVSVADTGTGMSEEVLARACEPFYTTKDVGKGSGLGLAQVYGFARQSGGGMRIRSAVGQGTTVELYLPRSFVPAEVPVGLQQQAGRAGAGRRTVLVVDDQDEVRDVAAAQLEALGYGVVQAASGKAALDLLGSGSGVDLLVVDYAMPGMSGTDLARAAREKCPDLPVLIVTGYADTARVDGQIPRARLMKKPYRMAELAGALDELLRPRHREDGAAKVVRLRSGED
jgi:PAS domain S-box-containing protein